MICGACREIFHRRVDNVKMRVSACFDCYLVWSQQLEPAASLLGVSILGVRQKKDGPAVIETTENQLQARFDLGLQVKDRGVSMLVQEHRKSPVRSGAVEKARRRLQVRVALMTRTLYGCQPTFAVHRILNEVLGEVTSDFIIEVAPADGRPESALALTTLHNDVRTGDCLFVADVRWGRG
jgi:hypothetical protein